ncbi:hypothetical protein D3C75_868290 [compost metagenome]
MVHNNITIRSVNEPRTEATAKARMIEITVCKIVSGIMMVSDGPKRVRIMFETDSPVLQLLP